MSSCICLLIWLSAFLLTGGEGGGDSGGGYGNRILGGFGNVSSSSFPVEREVYLSIIECFLGDTSSLDNDSRSAMFSCNFSPRFLRSPSVGEEFGVVDCVFSGMDVCGCSSGDVFDLPVIGISPVSSMAESIQLSDAERVDSTLGD